MKLVSKDEALALIARRISADWNEAAAQYADAARSGELTTYFTSWPGGPAFKNTPASWAIAERAGFCIEIALRDLDQLWPLVAPDRRGEDGEPELRPATDERVRSALRTVYAAGKQPNLADVVRPTKTELQMTGHKASKLTIQRIAGEEEFVRERRPIGVTKAR